MSTLGQYRCKCPHTLSMFVRAGAEWEVDCQFAVGISLLGLMVRWNCH